MVGRGSAVDNDVTIGARVRIQTGCYITAFSVIEDDVFVAPGVTLTNDDTMGRHGAGLRAARRRSCAAPAAWAAARWSRRGWRSARRRSWPPAPWWCATCPARAVVMGVPAREVREVADEDLLERWR